MGTVANLAVKIGANTQDFTAGLSNVATEVGGVSSKLSSIGAALAGAFTVTAIIGAAKQVIDFADKLENLSAKTGITTTGLQKLGLAFQSSGVSMDTVAQNATRLSKALIEGDKGVVNTLGKLGLSLSELKTLAPEQQFIKVADAIGSIPNPTERAFAAMQIFGRGGAELLQGMNGKLAETTAEFERMGMVIDAETIKSVDTFGDQIGILGKQFLAIGAEVLGPFLPLLSKLAEGLLYVARIIGDVLVGVIKWVQIGFLELGAGIARFLGSVAEAATHIPLLGKHLGFAGDAARWFYQDAAKADAQIAKLKDPIKGVGDVAKVTAPALIGLGGATSASSKEAEKAAAAWKKWNEQVNVGSKNLTYQMAQLGVVPPLIENANEATKPLASSTLDLSLAMAAVPWDVQSQGVKDTVDQFIYANSLIGQFVLGLQGVGEMALQSLSDNLAGAILQAQSFKDAFVNVWHNIKSSVLNILSDLLSQIINGFLKGLLGAIMGQQNAFGAALGGLFGGGGGGGLGGIIGGGGLLGKIPGLGSLLGLGGGAAAGGGILGASAAPSLGALLGAAPGGAAAAGAGAAASGGLMGTIGALATNPFTIAGAGVLALFASGVLTGGAKTLRESFAGGIYAKHGITDEMYNAARAGETIEDERAAYEAYQASKGVTVNLAVNAVDAQGVSEFVQSGSFIESFTDALRNNRYGLLTAVDGLLDPAPA